jgi:hypothetical protein
MGHIFESNIWINENFDGINLKDKRLNSRLKKMTSKIIENTEASLPSQMGTWKELTACYRLLNNPKVTHKLIQTNHIKRTKKIATNGGEKTILFPQDGSEIETQQNTKGTGPIGNHTCQGIMMHNCLAVEYDEQNPKVLGLANQRIWTRSDIVLHKSETRTQRNNRKGKESEHWLKTLQSIGSPPKGEKWVSIGDRANDIYEFFDGINKLNWHAVVRASQDRKVEVDGKVQSLKKWASSQPILGSRSINVRRKGETKPREIKLNISWGEIRISPPARLGKKKDSITLWVIRCFNEEEELDWILYSTIPISNLEEAIEKIKWYACRWIIEEYHKCLKTGCKIESNQFESSKPVKVLLGLLSMVSTLIIQIKHLARKDDDTLAKEVIPNLVLKIICKRYEKDEKLMTVREFWRTVAMLGGFLGRKGDGDPGWQTLWKGWLRLIDMWIGAQAMTELNHLQLCENGH